MTGLRELCRTAVENYKLRQAERTAAVAGPLNVAEELSRLQRERNRVESQTLENIERSVRIEAGVIVSVEPSAHFPGAVTLQTDCGHVHVRPAAWNLMAGDPFVCYCKVSGPVAERPAPPPPPTRCEGCGAYECLCDITPCDDDA